MWGVGGASPRASTLTAKAVCQPTKMLQDLDEEDDHRQHGDHLQTLQVHLPHVQSHGAAAGLPGPARRSGEVVGTRVCGKMEGGREGGRGVTVGPTWRAN